MTRHFWRQWKFNNLTLTVSVGLHLKILTLVITILAYEIVVSFLECVFLMTKPFRYQILTILNTWLWSWFLKSSTLARSIAPIRLGLKYLACVFLVTRPFQWYLNLLSINIGLWPTFQKPLRLSREKERDLTRSYDESTYTNRKFNNKLPPKTLITQRLWIDLRPSWCLHKAHHTLVNRCTPVF